MRRSEFKTLVTIGIIGAIVAASIYGGYIDFTPSTVSAGDDKELDTTTTVTIENPYNLPDGMSIDSASYIIFKNGTLTCAKNGETGYTKYTSTSANNVISTVLGELDGVGGLIYVKPGEYFLTETVNIPNEVQVVGAGTSTKFIREAGGSFSLFTFDDTSYSIGKAHQGLYNLLIDGNSENGGNGTALDLGYLDNRVHKPSFAQFDSLVIQNTTRGISAYKCYWLMFSNLVINNCSEYGIFLNLCYDDSFINVRVTGPDSGTGNTTGIYDDGVNNGYYNVDMSGLHTGFYIGVGGKICFQNCWMEYNDVEISAGDIRYVLTINCHFNKTLHSPYVREIRVDPTGIYFSNWVSLYGEWGSERNVTNMLYIASTGSVFIGDGASWTKVNSVNGLNVTTNLIVGGNLTVGTGLTLGTYTTTTLPAASSFPNGTMVWVSDASAGEWLKVAQSGTWYKVTLT